jgi:hypothetical protein
MLGFGACLDRIDWNIRKEETHYKTVRRLRFFVEQARRMSGPDSTGFVLNDSLAINYDLPEEEPFHLPTIWGFLLFLARTHSHLNRIDKEMGFPGVRTVWTAGQRLFDPAWAEGLSREPSGEDISHAKGVTWISETIEPPPELKKRIERVATYTPREFQLNLAFSKAYMLDEAGSAIGLKGPFVFVDESLVQILSTSLDGESRTAKDCWRYFVTDDNQETVRTITLQNLSYPQGKWSPYYLKLEKVNGEQDMRWGRTCTYRLMEIKGRSRYDLGDPVTISFEE